MKIRVSVLLDLSDIAPEAESEADALDAVSRLGWKAAHSGHKKALHEARQSDRPDEEKAVAMAQHLRGIMFTMMAEANTSVEILDSNTPVAIPDLRR